ncbi:MAG: acylphosphatase [bacterium]|nr:MAG: acylphosphatase [bacterium]
MSQDLYELHLIISGRVQGVGFRYFTQKEAQRLGIVGWVRNTMDERVEIVSSGDKAILEEFLSKVEQGPPGSTVTHIKTRWNRVDHMDSSDFAITY